jgi:hypothetical protein
MPIFMIERQFADQLELTVDGAEGVNRINDEEDVRWLMSFLSADKRKSYCLYEAKDPESIREAARRNNIPADFIIEVSETRPERILAAAGR